MPRNRIAECEKAAKMAAAVKEFLELKEIDPRLTMAEVARDHGVNQNTMRAHVRKASGPALNSQEEARLAGHAIGLFESGAVCSRKTLLEQAHIIQAEKNAYAEPVPSSWVDSFLDRHPDVNLQPLPEYRVHSTPTPANYREFWKMLGSAFSRHNIVDPSQVWYLHENPFFWDWDGTTNILGSMKRYDPSFCDILEAEEYPITTLLTYSASGQLLLPMLLFEEGELHEGGFQYGIQIINGSGTDYGLRDEAASMRWLEMFNVFSKKHIQPDQYRLVCMDASSDISQDFVDYAFKNKILICDLRNYSPIHDQLSRPADAHIYSEMRKLYHGTKDRSLVDEEEQTITRRGFYASFSKFWEMKFGDPDICRQAFRDAGVFPIDMSKNEEVMSLIPSPTSVSQNDEISAFSIADLRYDSVLQLEDINRLIDERLSKSAAGTLPADHSDYLLILHARLHMKQQADRIGALNKEIAQLKAVGDKENVMPGLAVRSEASKASATEETGLRESKRPAAQAQSSEKRRRLDA